MIYADKKVRSDKGFSLIECLIAMVITTVGLLAAAGLIVVGVRLQVESRDATSANALARAKIEELENYAPTAKAEAAFDAEWDAEVRALLEKHYGVPVDSFEGFEPAVTAER